MSADNARAGDTCDRYGHCFADGGGCARPECAAHTVCCDCGASDLVRALLVALCAKNDLDLDSDADPGTPARNYELAMRLGVGEVFGCASDNQRRRLWSTSPRPWLCPEPRCTPLLNLRDGDYPDITKPEPGQSWTCWGRMDEPVTFIYDGVTHPNDLNCCHYTPLKGLIRWQENADDWNVLASYYSLAHKKVRAQEPAVVSSHDDISALPEHLSGGLGPEIAGGRDANQGAPRPPVPPSEPS